MHRTPSNSACRFRRAQFAGCFALAAALCAAAPAWGEPPWDSMPYTTFEAMQAVAANGSPSWSLPTWGVDDEQGFKLLGVVLNDSQDILDGTPNYIPCAPGTQWQLGGQWQIFVQAVDPNDFGGTALWLGQNYGNISGPPAYHWPDSSYSYTDAEWEAEIARLTLDHTLQPGDIIEITARGALFHNGKFNVNEQHDNDPHFDFDITLVAHGALPEATLITLADVKNVEDDSFNFVADRQSGAEHYQSTLVRLANMQLVDPADWHANSLVTITDGELTLPMLLGLNGFDAIDAPTGTFDVVGIFDQEGSDYRAGYRLWVTDASQFAAVPEPASAALLLAATSILGVAGLRQRRRKG